MANGDSNSNERTATAAPLTEDAVETAAMKVRAGKAAAARNAAVGAAMRANAEITAVDLKRPRKKRVVIVGAGFGGLAAARALARRTDCEVLLIDRKNHHLFQPLLYQVATAALSPADIAVPIRSQFRTRDNVEVHLGEVDSIDAAGHLVHAGGYAIPYDRLVVATGAQHAYFGHSEWEEFAPGLKTLEQATEIRRRVLVAFENAENSVDEAERTRLLTFVVIGGGPTGAELAGALAEISRNVIAEDFRRIDPKLARIVLVEAGDRVLAMFRPELSARAERDLKTLGMEVRTKTRVTAVDADGVAMTVPATRAPGSEATGEITLSISERLEAATVIWAAGVYPSPLGKTLGVPLDPSGRVIVGPDLSLAQAGDAGKDVFVIGDLAHAVGADGRPLPGLAPVALQSGKFVANAIRADFEGKPRGKFKYLDKGQMATIGKRRAVVQTGPLEFTGWFAWVTWLFVHILYLVGFRNRAAVLTQWGWSFLFSQRSARLIVGKTWRFYAGTATPNPTGQPAAMQRPIPTPEPKPAGSPPASKA